MSNELQEENLSSRRSREEPSSRSEWTLYIIVGIIVVLVLAGVLLMFGVSS
ncbi:MAG: hypothetical protein GTO18_14910 [Anaerolineales bacterium]|nr:hypothetical protein [Anaerolineales bacterium]